MLHFSVNQMTTLRWSLEEELFNYRAAGISMMGLWKNKVLVSGIDHTIELVRESGMSVSNLVWSGGFTGYDGMTLSEAVDDGMEALHLAAALQCPNLVLLSGGQGGHTLTNARRLFAESLQELLPVAETIDVNIALEPMLPAVAADWTVIYSLADACDMLAQLNSPRLKIVFDTFHMGMHKNVIEHFADLVPHISVVHLSDGKMTADSKYERCRLGTGQVPLEKIVPALLNNGFDGDFDVELHGAEFQRCNYIELLHHSRAVYQRLCNESPPALFG